MVRMNFIFIFISSSDPNLLQKKSVKQKIKKRWPKAANVDLSGTEKLGQYEACVRQRLVRCLKFQL